jgi:hypothetical protein
MSLDTVTGMLIGNFLLGMIVGSVLTYLVLKKFWLRGFK